MDPLDPAPDAADQQAGETSGTPQLENAQMEILLEFQQVTGVEDIEESRRVLDEHGWDLIAAINGFMGFELPQAAPSFHNHNEPGPSVQRRFTPRVDPADAVNRNGGAFGPIANRNGAFPQSIFMWVWKLVRSPVELFFRIFWKVLGVGLQFIRGDPRHAITDSGEDVEEFIRQYEETYGTQHPTFFKGSYSQALQEARKELKFLLAYLHCDDHIDTPKFCRQVMSNEGFRDFVRENMVFWGCSVSKPEGFRTSQALRENTYPFLALIVLKNNKMTVVKRIEGETQPETVLGIIHQAVADNEVYLVAERQDRLERSMTQTLRQQQDEAYLESLRADQEKDRKKKEEEEKKRLEELEEQRIVDEEQQRKDHLKQRKSDILLNLKEEPPAGDPGVIKVVIKLPNGTRLERRFYTSDSMKHLFEFVFSHPQSPDSFEVATNFPKRTLPCVPDDGDDPPSFADFGIQKNEMLFVYDLES